MTATTAAQAAYIVAALLFILSLAGLSKHESARQGIVYGIAGMAIALVVCGVLLSLLPWGDRSHAKDDPSYDEFLAVEHYDPDPETSAITVPATTQRGADA